MAIHRVFLRDGNYVDVASDHYDIRPADVTFDDRNHPAIIEAAYLELWSEREGEEIVVATFPQDAWLGVVELP